MIVKSLLFVLVAIATYALLATCGACSPRDSTALRVLHGAGYTSVRLGSYPWFACGRDDKFNASFTAVGPAGDVVTGAVCCGVLKSCTVRVD